MLRAALTILVALVVAFAAFALLAPASLLDRRLAAATDGKLRLSDTEGTVWHGRGSIGDARGAWRVPVAWEVDPLALARGALAVTFEPRGDGGPRGRVALAEGSVELIDASFALPAIVIRSWIGDRPLPEAGGTLTLDAPHFRYDGRAGDGAIDLRWDRARLVFGDAVVDLGTVRGRAMPRGADLAGTLDNAGGALRIDGDFKVSAESASVRATLVTGPTVAPEIARGLATLGASEPGGAVRIEWRTGAR
jgi:hypothetical protein